MVIDSLHDVSTYEHINPLFAKAFQYLQETDFSNAPVGKVELDGDNLFAIVSDSTMKTTDNAKLEVHEKYIDIQMPVSGSETFGWKTRADLAKPSAPYNPEKDIQFFEDQYDTCMTLAAGNFAIFFPSDAHAPCIGKGTIRKVVVKVKVMPKY